MSGTERETLTARIPTDINMPDKVLLNLTARQALILASTGLVATWVYLLAGKALPTPVLAAIVVPILTVGGALALGRRDGVGLDRLCVFAVQHLRKPKTLLPEGEKAYAPPTWCRQRGNLPAPFRHPVRALREDGVMELAEGGIAVIVRAATVSFGLRTPAEQAALVSVFAGWLNSLEAPVQIVLRARPVDLSGIAEQITRAAPRLADPGLEEAARSHAEFLADLNVSHNLLTRDVLVVLRHEIQPTTAAPRLRPGGRRGAHREAGAAIVLRRAADTVRSLIALGLFAEVLAAPAAHELLTHALRPGEPARMTAAQPEDVITLHEEP